MSPSVALSQQQCKVIEEHLPAYRVLSLTGRDGLDKWTDQKLWDAVLTNVRVVVGTPAVLTDALTHGFVSMHRLALLIFDEAHNCLKQTPMNCIMQLFYHPRKLRGDPVPSILGLSASPVMSTKRGSLEQVEKNLDAITVTPKEERIELARYVHPPQLSAVIYRASSSLERLHASGQCASLHQAADRYDFEQDPYIMDLKQQGDEWAQKRLTKAQKNRKTFGSEQVRVLSRRAETLLEQLGHFAAEWYISSYILRFETSVCGGAAVLPDVSSKEHQHVLQIFRAISSNTASHKEDDMLNRISDKASKLLNLLQNQVSPSFRGIVFVEQRAMVAALIHLLRSSDDLSKSYNVGGFVGTSSFTGRSGVADLANAREQEQDLKDFATGSKNLMVATNVLEEGIDVSACNHVICFDPPKNLVSFVQRRGRARQKGSKYYVFLADDEPGSDGLDWQVQEANMKLAYMSDTRGVEASVTDDEEALVSRLYRINSTGAVLTLANAKAHLYHFCAVSTLQASNYVDTRPEFSPVEEQGETAWVCTVTLPSFVHPDLRTASSSMSWRTENAAIQDAAFEAYVALHKAGLVNDNLLPLVKNFGPETGQDHVDQPSIVTVSEQRSMWQYLAKRQAQGEPLYPHKVTLECNREEFLAMDFWLPASVGLDRSHCFPLYWNQCTTYECYYEPGDMSHLPNQD